MIKIGLTGGIGSGKSTVAAFFSDLGIPVYDSDSRAKSLMEEDPALRNQIIGLLGDEAYEGSGLNRSFISGRVFSEPELLERLNGFVHPAVRRDFSDWCAAQDAPYVIQEAAILFETGGYLKLDRNILVTAPEDVRIRRVIERDGVGEPDVRARMAKQWDDARKAGLADFIIVNHTLPHTRQQVEEIHGQLLELSDSAGPGDC